MSISLKELLGKYEFKDLPSDHQGNLMILLERINKIRTAYGKPMSVSSGYRSMEDHIAIYKKIAGQKRIVFDESKVPKASKHLYGQAVDIADPDESLAKWVRENVKLLEEIGLWIEDQEYTKGWEHFQCLPPKSGKRFFIP